MWITQHIVARAFVWLAAMAMPVQGLPSVACGCARVTHIIETIESSQDCCSASNQSDAGRCPCTGAKVCHCGEDSCCKRQESTCCCKNPAAEQCCCSNVSCPCSAEGNCSCGANCQCGKNNTPSVPVAPPVESNSTDRVVADSAAIPSVATIHQPSTSRHQLGVYVGADALTSLDRCVILCRFTT